MIELADHIGAYEALLICAEFGGREIYIPADPGKNPFLALIGAERAAIVANVYKHNVFAVPTARFAIARVLREPLIAAARSGEITVTEAARRLGLRRDYVSRLVNRVDVRTCPPHHSPARDRRQLDMFGEE